MKKLSLLLAILLISTNAFASCVKIDLSQFSDDEKPAIWGHSYAITGEKPTNERPYNDGQVCFKTDQGAKISTASLRDYFDQSQANETVVIREKENKKAQLKTLVSDIKSSHANWNGLNSAQKEALYKKAIEAFLMSAE